MMWYSVYISRISSQSLYDNITSRQKFLHGQNLYLFFRIVFDQLNKEDHNIFACLGILFLKSAKSTVR
ncbi:MAG: hypothetical protein KTM48_00765, partial [Wolbachia endosymbiont of Pissodes strobi]|nr:hypothetical protein [Wolbachia endosymbiont of Pissodes strobi]